MQFRIHALFYVVTLAALAVAALGGWGAAPLAFACYLMLLAAVKRDEKSMTRAEAFVFLGAILTGSAGLCALYFVVATDVQRISALQVAIMAAFVLLACLPLARDVLQRPNGSTP